jgi:uncharacterized membrane protein
MILLYIYLAISIVAFLQVVFATIDANAKFKKRYAHITYKKESFGESISTWFRVILTCFFPIINIIMSVTLLLQYDTCVESSIEKVYNKYNDQDKEN